MKRQILALIVLPFLICSQSLFQLLPAQNINDRIDQVIMPDKQGKPLSINELRGKYVLLHFWASWCPNSRINVPNYARLYEKYKNVAFTGANGFEIYSVNFDDNPYDWQRGEKEHQITWKYSVSDYKKFEGTIAQVFKLEKIPAMFLVDPNGRIIAKDIGMNELDWRLSELTGNIAQYQGGETQLSGNNSPNGEGWGYFTNNGDFHKIADKQTKNRQLPRGYNIHTRNGKVVKVFYETPSYFDETNNEEVKFQIYKRVNTEYAIEIGTFYSINPKDFEALKKVGEVIYITDHNKRTTKVVLGPYNNRNNAERMKNKLVKAGFARAKVIN